MWTLGCDVLNSHPLNMEFGQQLMKFLWFCTSVLSFWGAARIIGASLSDHFWNRKRWLLKRVHPFSGCTNANRLLWRKTTHFQEPKSKISLFPKKHDNVFSNNAPKPNILILFWSRLCSHVLSSMLAWIIQLNPHVSKVVRCQSLEIFLCVTTWMSSITSWQYLLLGMVSNGVYCVEWCKCNTALVAEQPQRPNYEVCFFLLRSFFFCRSRRFCCFSCSLKGRKMSVCFSHFRTRLLVVRAW